VLKALGTPTSSANGAEPDLSSAEIIPNEFPEVHEEEE